MPILNYTSQTASTIGVAFVDMPAKAKILFVATTSGVEIPSPSTALSNGGSGAANIPIPTLLPGSITCSPRTWADTTSHKPLRSISEVG